jgi:hypothetical protein
MRKIDAARQYSKALTVDPDLMLKCPFCKLDFKLGKRPAVNRRIAPELGHAKAGR